MIDAAVANQKEAREESLPGVLAGIAAMVVRELHLARRARGEILQPLLFFVVVASLLPLGVGPDRATLATIGPGVIWICSLLAALLSLPRLFAQDAADATLEQWLLSPYPLAALAGGKMLAHWLLTGLPLALIAPLLGLSFGLNGAAIGLLVVSLLLGTPLLSMLGTVAAALTLSTNGNSVLLALLLLPLYAPVLIFGAGAVEALRAGVDVSGPLMLLGAGSLIGAVLAPLAAAAALRISVE